MVVPQKEIPAMTTDTVTARKKGDPQRMLKENITFTAMRLSHYVQAWLASFRRLAFLIQVSMFLGVNVKSELAFKAFWLQSRSLGLPDPGHQFLATRAWLPNHGC